MNFELQTLTLAQAASDSQAHDLLVVLVSQDFEGGAHSDGPLCGLIAQALEHKDLEPQPGKVLELYQAPGVAARRVVLAGVGSGSPKDVQHALQACAAALKSSAVQSALLCFTTATPSVSALAAALQSAAQVSYVYRSTKTQKAKKEPSTPTNPNPNPNPPTGLQKITLGVSPQMQEGPQGEEVSDAVQSAFAQAVAIAAGVELAREWANRPANHATPQHLAQAAQELAAAQHNLHCQIFGPQEVEKLGMGAFLSVARASHEPLRFIELRYEGAAHDQAPIVLVGKGITFDTGGISLKPAAGMDEMKFDMSGAASVLGVFRALAQLQPAVNVVGLIAACENMPGGSATKPGDVVTSLEGQTIEILNTDAEGRLVLCDALTYAARFKPAALIDIATLTGACVIALGGVRSGLFSNNEALAGALQQAGDAAQDLCWRMPLDDDYAEGLKSNFADVANVAGREAGSVTAAKFLQRFVGDTPWAHLDIAGTAWKSGAAKGGTGRPVALLVHYLLQQQSGVAAAVEAPAHGLTEEVTESIESIEVKAEVKAKTKDKKPKVKDKAKDKDRAKNKGKAKQLPLTPSA